MYILHRGVVKKRPTLRSFNQQTPSHGAAKGKEAGFKRLMKNCGFSETVLLLLIIIITIFVENNNCYKSKKILRDEKMGLQ